MRDNVFTGSKVRFGDLRAILHYVPVFRGRTFVVAVDGAILASEQLTPLLLDLAVLQSLNIRVVLVHGAGHQVRQLAAQRGVVLTSSDGTGATDETTLEVSIDAITRLASALMQRLTAVGIRGASANALIAHRLGIAGGVDHLHTGSIDRVDSDSLRTFLNDGMLPVIAPLGYDRQGSTLRLNSDGAAVEIALALQADKILFVTESSLPAEMRPSLRHLSTEDAAGLLQSGESRGLSASHLSKLRHGLQACRDGVRRVHILDGKLDEALLAELFSNEGVGIMIYGDAYQEIRPATVNDAAAIHEMIRRPIDDEQLAPRTVEKIRESIGDYSVVEVDGNVVACVACHAYPPEHAVELACLFVKRSHENQGYGRKLVEWAVKRSQAAGAACLFALTTNAREFFEQQAGFELADITALPLSRRAQWEASGRRSDVLVRRLS